MSAAHRGEKELLFRDSYLPPRQAQTARYTNSTITVAPLMDTPVVHFKHTGKKNTSGRKQDWTNLTTPFCVAIMMKNVLL